MIECGVNKSFTGEWDMWIMNGWKNINYRHRIDTQLICIYTSDHESVRKVIAFTFMTYATVMNEWVTAARTLLIKINYRCPKRERYACMNCFLQLKTIIFLTSQWRDASFSLSFANSFTKKHFLSGQLV